MMCRVLADLQSSLDLHLKEDASLAEKNFVIEKALKQVTEENKKMGKTSVQCKSVICNSVLSTLTRN